MKGIQIRSARASDLPTGSDDSDTNLKGVLAGA
jgi:hypothetical protein